MCALYSNHVDVTKKDIKRSQNTNYLSKKSDDRGSLRSLKRFPPEGEAYVSINRSHPGRVLHRLSETDAIGVDSIQTTEEVKKYHTQQSRHLPNWAWFVLAKSLGIKLHELDKPWFGTLLHVLTLAFGIGYMITNTWFIGYDIYSLYTKQTLMTGCVNMLVGLVWSAMGVYANLVAGNLFSNRKFRECVRMHTKTILKISAATVMGIMATTVVVINLVRNYDNFDENQCHGLYLNLDPMICHVRYVCHVGISFFTLVWNLLVGFVMLSVCRTHTIGLRRFIKVLEEDGKAYVVYRQKIAAAQTQYLMTSQHADSYYYDPLEEDQYMWDDDLTILSDSDFLGMPGQRPHLTPSRNVNIPNQRAQGTGEHSLPSSLPQGMGLSTSQDEQYFMSRPRQISLSAPHGSYIRGRRLTNRQTSATDDELEDQDAKQRKGKIVASDKQQHQDEAQVESKPACSNENDEKRKAGGQNLDQDSVLLNIEEDGENISASCSVDLTPSPCLLAHKRASCQSETGSEALMSKILTNEDILVSYWRISSRLRATSLAMQRWLASWIFFITLWSANYVIYWLSHPATIAGILEVALPLCLLPLVCSAFAEVNNEATRLVKCVCPTGERLGLLSYLEKYPLEMTLFGYRLSYGDILKVILAFALAFSSRIILDEVFGSGGVPTPSPTSSPSSTVAAVTDVLNSTSLL
ncbi:uncharacterized protein LOC106152049 [Lingula anatina]|uniref:Uncharacterized protein LOC106152049 n=1 Tax=Lingula anatina TaxID=7574 RepID=A0A1S3H4P0_LINAN|nr:uncharacterized protein LOC106152049 [Lingula anatina]|eukprot:XP_013380973.1 uncharacterized protein LOC106152049 [Lingula anatina]